MNRAVVTLGLLACACGPLGCSEAPSAKRSAAVVGAPTTTKSAHPLASPRVVPLRALTAAAIQPVRFVCQGESCSYRGAGLRLRIAEGVQVQPERGVWRFGLSLRRAGRGSALAATSPRGLPRLQRRRLIRSHGLAGQVFEEWFVDRMHGVEHGFTLPTRWPGEGGAVVLELALEGDLEPSLDSARGSVELKNASGQRRLRYRDLTVRDRVGRRLPAHFSLADRRTLRIAIDDAQASYPITVDPLLIVEIPHDPPLHTPDQAPSATLGSNRAVVGDPSSGHVFVFRSTVNGWSLEAKLTSSDRQDGDGFGSSVAINGNNTRIVVGAPRHDDGGNVDSGTAYVFERGGSVWAQKLRLPAAPRAASSLFGQAVALSTTRIAIGVPGDSTTLPSGGAVQLHAPDGTPTDELRAKSVIAKGRFGSAVALSTSADQVVVGAPAVDNTVSNNEHVYLFYRKGGAWAFALANSGAGKVTTGYGSSVALGDGKVLVVGAPQYGAGDGQVFRYDVTTAGDQTVTLTNPVSSPGTVGSALGTSVASGVDPLWVAGAPGPAAAPQLLFPGLSQWYLLPRSTGQLTGEAVAIEPTASSRVLVAGRLGPAYVLEKVGSNWTLEATLDFDAREAGGKLGTSVAIDPSAAAGPLAIVGAPGEAGGRGRVYMLRLNGGSWQQEGSFVGSAPLDGLGRSVAVDGTTAVAGAPQTPSSATCYVEVYRYLPSPTPSWVRAQQLTFKGKCGAQRFGAAVGVADTFVAVGMPGDDSALAYYQGAVAIFRKNTSTGLWELQSLPLKASVPIDGEQLGSALVLRALAGGSAQLVVGAPALPIGSFSGGKGRAILYNYGLTGWTQAQTFVPTGSHTGDAFGASVAQAANGDIAIGAPGTDVGNVSGAGAVAVFSSPSWQETTLTASTPAANGSFGSAVSFDDDSATLAVGAAGDAASSPAAGATYLFFRANGSWVQRHRLTLTAAQSPQTGQRFGSAVALGQRHLVIGSSGRAFLGMPEAGQIYTYDIQSNDAGSACASADACMSGYCVDGTCCETPCMGVCKRCNASAQLGTCTDVPAGQPDLVATTPCSGGDLCNGSGVCKKGLGATCSNAADCYSGFCADGFCCDKACDQTCFACALALNGKDDGTCASVLQYKPDLVAATPCDNAGNSVCDGNPTAPQCVVKPGGLCSGPGDCSVNEFCVDGICCSSPCDGVCKICKLVGNAGICGEMDYGQIDSFPVNACEGQQRCDGAGQCKKLQGESCGGQNECLTGFCVDGVCCATECKGVCESCALPGQVGTCQAIAANSDPASECIGTSPQCGGLCNGNRACDFPGAGTVCGLCRACDGTGQCAGTPEDDPACGPIDCDGLDSACRDYVDIKSKRCASFGKCKAPNVPETCLVFAETCNDGGPARDAAGPGDAAGKSDGLGKHEAGAKSDGGVTQPPADGGCGCRTGHASASAGAWWTMLALLMLVWRRRSGE